MMECPALRRETADLRFVRPVSPVMATGSDCLERYRGSVLERLRVSGRADGLCDAECVPVDVRRIELGSVGRASSRANLTKNIDGVQRALSHPLNPLSFQQFELLFSCFT